VEGPAIPGRPLAVVTDLDGCLLDEHTYSWTAARPALEALRRRAVPLVLASSKTRAEMEALAAEIGAVAALVVENGGAIVPVRGLPGLAAPVVLGERRAALVTALADVAVEAGARVRGFAGMAPSELSALTGLDPEAARRALDREYDEPFVLEAGEAAAIAHAAAVRGLAHTRGGRFHHLTGRADKGLALRALREGGRRAGWDASWLALGDSPNDLAMLAGADRAVLVPRPDGRVDRVLAAALPHADVAHRPGPEGWNTAVLRALQEEW
jgi:mannosyl-3-phosphoglycerate phosphatase family protein